MIKRGAIVLGARVERGGSPSPALQRRLALAERLWQGGGLDFVIVSGGCPDPQAYPGAEADVMAAVLRKGPIPADAIWQEKQSRTTRENALYGLACAARLGASHLTIITDCAHLPRAMLVFAIVGRGRGIRITGAGAALPWAWATIRAYGREGVAFGADLIRAWWVRSGT